MEMTNGALVRAFDGHVKAVESLRQVQSDNELPYAGV